MANPTRSIVVNEDPTLEYFTNLTNVTGSISSNVNHALLSYFEQFSKDKDAARVLAYTVTQTAFANSLDPMEVLEEFRKKPPGELSVYVAMFLNLNRVGTSYLGTTKNRTVNQYVHRAILP